MKFRLTIKEIKEKSDLELLRILIVERRSTLNMYSPLNKRLGEIENKLNKIINHNDNKEKFDLNNMLFYDVEDFKDNELLTQVDLFTREIQNRGLK